MLDNLIGAPPRQTCAIGKKKGHQQNSDGLNHLYQYCMKKHARLIDNNFHFH
ncbi:beta-ketoacyl synthase [Shigella sonnei]|nr:beta-ketoacyl synthase [Shigella sonnei]